jgi:hypothetical protein
MAASGTLSQHLSFPAPPPSGRSTADQLRTLKRWRAGCIATGLVAAASLPLSAWSQLTDRRGAVVALLLATVLALVCHVTRETRLRILLVYPEFAHLPDLARKQRRLVSARSRGALADELRHLLATPQPPSRFDLVPVLHERVASVSSQLLEIATTLEAAHDPDPTAVALIRELLRDGCSPLYNPQAPATGLHVALERARPGLASRP